MGPHHIRKRKEKKSRTPECDETNATTRGPSIPLVPSNHQGVSVWLVTRCGRQDWSGRGSFTGGSGSTSHDVLKRSFTSRRGAELRTRAAHMPAVSVEKNAAACLLPASFRAWPPNQTNLVRKRRRSSRAPCTTLRNAPRLPGKKFFRTRVLYNTVEFYSHYVLI
jgi:hypothetical protein